MCNVYNGRITKALPVGFKTFPQFLAGITVLSYRYEISF